METTQDRTTIEARLIEKISKYKAGVEALSAVALDAREAMKECMRLKIWADHYDSPDEWLHEECGISKTWAYELATSQKTILQIEDAAPPAVKKQVKATIEKLPIKQIQRLSKLTPKKAAKAVARAIETPGVRPIEKKVDDEIEEESLPVLKTTPSKLKVNQGFHPVLAAMDREWDKIKAEMSMFEVKPGNIYARLREVVQKHLI